MKKIVMLLPFVAFFLNANTRIITYDKKIIKARLYATGLKHFANTTGISKMLSGKELSHKEFNEAIDSSIKDYELSF